MFFITFVCVRMCTYVEYACGNVENNLKDLVGFFLPCGSWWSESSPSLTAGLYPLWAISLILELPYLILHKWVFAYMSVSCLNTPSTCNGQKRVSDPPETWVIDGLWAPMNWTQVLWKKSQYSCPLSHLSTLPTPI